MEERRIRNFQQTQNSRETRKSHKIRNIVILFLAVIVFSVSAFALYVNDYYPASEEAIASLTVTGGGYQAESQGDNLIFLPEQEESCDTGLIFYPGAKVEYTAYAPLMEKFAKEGILCVLVKMPWNLAALDSNAADGIQEDFPEITHWYIGGHSLGGAIAAYYLSEHQESFDGLFLLAAYTIKDLSGAGLKCAVLYGTEDGVLNMDRFRKNEKYLPEGTILHVIEGGCHAWFGDYGTQKGDGTPTISREEQMAAAVQVFLEMSGKQ